MDDARLLKTVFYGNLQHDKRGVGHPKLKYKYCVKHHLSSCNILLSIWEIAAKDWKTWQHHTNETVAVVERRLEEELRDKIQRWAGKTANSIHLESMQAPVHFVAESVVTVLDFTPTLEVAVLLSPEWQPVMMMTR